MRLTKYSHSCVRLEDSGRTLVIDPGTFSEADTALAGADAVLITHEHPDHIDEKAVRTAAAARPDLPIYGPPGVAAALADLGDRVTAVVPGQAFETAGFAVRTFGGEHAVIYPSLPGIVNVGYLIDDAIFHPGDSLQQPGVPVSTLLAPISAPWGKASEFIDFIIGVGAPRVHQLHDGIINANGTGLIERLINALAGPSGVTYEHLAPATSVTL